ncbi:hypothetical protein [Nostoc sp.]|uniref:hypothetical protein n=1 Tax=Nostoc sp. TaxID=1180 RepID=UPI002FF71876
MARRPTHWLVYTRLYPPFLRNAKGERGLRILDFVLVHGGGLCLCSREFYSPWLKLTRMSNAVPLPAWSIYLKIAVMKFFSFPCKALSANTMALSADAMALSTDAMALSADAMALSADAIALSGDAMALSAHAMALSAHAMAKNKLHIESDSSQLLKPDRKTTSD